MRKTILLLAAFCLMASQNLRADEGMWLINLIERGLQKNMQERGLKLDPGVIYDENAVTLSDAVVSLAFGCTGSMISDEGLMITNHHCAYSDIHALSTPEHNYLEDGFWAMQRSDEIPVNGDGIWFLKRVMDVTGEVNALRDSTGAEGKVMGMRKVYHIIESRYSKLYAGQGEVSCCSMWGGEKYYMALYQVYKDVRLVAAPPVCIASFGAEVDNWEWPQHKCDFALYRIYTAPDGSPAEYSPENVPLRPKNKLKICTSGVHPGDYTMVIGYPGHTDRYASSFKVESIKDIRNPIQACFRGEQMKIIDRWMNTDPQVRLKYADYYFGLTNVQEIREGEVYCYNRFGVVAKKAEQESELQQWIDSDPVRKAEYGSLLADLKAKYEAVADIERQTTCFQETLVRGIRITRLLNFMKNGGMKHKKEKDLKFCLKDDPAVANRLESELAQLDFRVEHELFVFSVKKFYESVRRDLWGDYLAMMYDKFKGDTESLAESIWRTTIFRSEASVRDFFSTRHSCNELEKDPLFLMMNSSRMADFNDMKSQIEGVETLSSLERRFKHLVYSMRLEKGIPQYPDANSTMRLTYGAVCDITPRDAVRVSDHTTSRGILEKYDPSVYIFSLKPELKSLFEKEDWGRWADGSTDDLHVDFMTDNDITGGNSGSPVLNAEGELVGLAFDGNKESLAGDTWFDPDMNRCICVDIRYVFWTLDKYAGMDHIIKEIFD